MIRKLIFNTKNLAKKSDSIPPIEIKTNEVQNLINDMIDTVDYYSLQINARAISACQIGEYKKIIVVKRFKFLKKFDIYINLRILEQQGSIKGEEGCLSLPNVFLKIKRPTSITVSYYDENGKICNEKLRGALARLICHEVDHGDGITIIDRNKEQFGRDDER